MCVCVRERKRLGESERAAEGGGGLDLFAVSTWLTQLLIGAETAEWREQDMISLFICLFVGFFEGGLHITQISVYRSTSRSQAAEPDTQRKCQGAAAERARHLRTGTEWKWPQYRNSSKHKKKKEKKKTLVKTRRQTNLPGVWWNLVPVTHKQTSQTSGC